MEVYQGLSAHSAGYKGDPMYSPKINEEFIPKLYKLAKAEGKPMTKLVNEIIQKHITDIEKKKNFKLAFGEPAEKSQVCLH